MATKKAPKAQKEATTTGANGEKAPRKRSVRVVFHKGLPIALVRARSATHAIRFVVGTDYEAPVADQDHLISLAGKLSIQDATAQEAAEDASAAAAA